MLRTFLIFVMVLNFASSTHAQDMPAQLRGKWIVKRVIQTSTISCWGSRESKALIGTEIEYTAQSFRWKDNITRHPSVAVSVLDAEQFHRDNSGGGANDSQVSFRELGLTAAMVTQISLGHPDADITGATIEIPGDRVLIKDRDAIVLSVCNVYFEARREPVPDGSRK